MRSLLRALKRDPKCGVLITLKPSFDTFRQAVLYRRAKILSLIKFLHGMIIFPTRVLCGNQYHLFNETFFHEKAEALICIP